MYKYFDFKVIFVFSFRNVMPNPLLKPSRNTSPKWARLSVLTRMVYKKSVLGISSPETSLRFPVIDFYYI